MGWAGGWAWEVGRDVTVGSLGVKLASQKVEQEDRASLGLLLTCEPLGQATPEAGCVNLGLRKHNWAI